MEYKTDVIIAGAGISGLLIASELSKKFKVIILDSNRASIVQKFWITNESCLKHNKELIHLIDSIIDSMDIIDAYRNTRTIKSNNILWKSKKLVSFLKNKIYSNGGEIYFDHRFYGYRNNGSYINVYANEKTFRSKLLVDCMGYASPLMLAKSTISIKGYYAIYGATIKLKKAIRPICLSNVIISNKPNYFELFPDSQNNAHAIIISPTQRVESMSAYAKEFKYIIEKSHYTSYFEDNCILSPLQGIIPIGKIRKPALDNIFFYGESAQSNPAATGTLLTKMLQNYKGISTFLEKKIELSDLSARSLKEAPISLNNFNRKIQLIVYEKLLLADSDTFSNYLKQLSNISDETIHKFVYGNLDIKDVFSSKKIRKLMSGKHPDLTKSLVRSLFR